MQRETSLVYLTLWMQLFIVQKIIKRRRCMLVMGSSRKFIAEISSNFFPLLLFRSCSLLPCPHPHLQMPPFFTVSSAILLIAFLMKSIQPLCVCQNDKNTCCVWVDVVNLDSGARSNLSKLNYFENFAIINKMYKLSPFVHYRGVYLGLLLERTTSFFNFTQTKHIA